MLKKASEVIASGDTRAVVDFAIEVNREVAHRTRELDKAKAHLRKVALGRDETRERTIEIEGNVGVATVTFSPDAVKVRKGRDLKDLEANLSSTTFARLFTKQIVVTPVRELPDLLGALDDPERSVVERFVEVTPSTPKVFLTQ